MNRTDRGANDGGSLGDLAVTQENTGDAVVTGSRLISSATGGARTRKPRRTAGYVEPTANITLNLLSDCSRDLNPDKLICSHVNLLVARRRTLKRCE